MKNIKLLFIIFILVLLISAKNLLAQTSYVVEIDSLLAGAFNQGNFNGNALVAKNNQIIYAESFGYTDASKDIKLTQATRFNIGSIYKEFSAVALMMLMEEGKLNLEDSISTFIPSLPLWGNTIKIRDLLQYTSGLPNLKWSTINNDTDILNDLMNIDTLQFEPGSDYFYNNNDIALRQFIVERVSGIPFNLFVKTYLFDPAGMNSSITNPTIHTDNLAIAYSNSLVNDKIETRFSGVIYVTAGDLLKWDRSLKGYQFISKESTKILGQSYNGNQSALGNVEFKEEKWITHLHNGESRNFEAILYSNYLNNYTIILLGNNKNRMLFELKDALIKILDSQH